MSELQSKKIAYLFGAGATNAELSNIGTDLNESGLLISDVTRRVTIEAKKDAAFLVNNRMFLERAANSSNIELFISLIESNSSDIREALAAVDRLKEMVEKDIKAVLTPQRLGEFYLHKALFELHKHSQNETVIGLISLNYDTVLDEALPLFNHDYSYQDLQHEHPRIAEKIENYKLDFVTYDMSSLEEGTRDKLIREIFRRLQLGIRLNSGERLKALQGTIRDFVFNELGNAAPFIRSTGLSDKRFSRQFTMAQICLNSFKRKEIGDFSRARLQDLEEFFNDNANLPSEDANLNRIRSVLKAMDTAFGPRASNISSRAVAVSAYLFAEDLYLRERADLMPQFAIFYIKLLDEIKRNMEFIKRYKNAENTEVMEEFQKHILQASVEPSAIRRRDRFLKRAFDYFMDPATQGRLIGTK